MQYHKSLKTMREKEFTYSANRVTYPDKSASSNKASSFYTMAKEISQSLEEKFNQLIGEIIQGIKESIQI